VVGFEARDPAGYGRLLLDADGGLEAIVEHKEATPDQLKVTICNSGVMAAPAALMFSLLAQVKNENSKGEYYLTDVVELARAHGAATRAVMADEDAVMGVNAQGELAQAEALFQSVQRDAAMARGVHMPAPDTVHFSWDTEIEGGVTVEPYVVFGPGVTVTSGARIRAFSHIEGATVGADAQVGPYARLRPGAVLGADVHVGNFVEVKNVEMGPGSKANHLTYLGDGSVGARANIGAGTIFCNYDGFFKYRTEVGEGALIGSNTALVAPIRVGANAMTGSGAVITEDVPDGALAIARAKQVIKPGWDAAYRSFRLAVATVSQGDAVLLDFRIAQLGQLLVPQRHVHECRHRRKLGVAMVRAEGRHRLHDFPAPLALLPGRCHGPSGRHIRLGVTHDEFQPLGVLFGQGTRGGHAFFVMGVQRVRTDKSLQEFIRFAV
jgi:bifunctional UDP-N-acetylglucosamine pyrophosphorylase/glucosamine-1-phosphate N-acetyltransferase